MPPVLLYHAVGSPPSDSDTEERNLFVEPDRFAWQMSSLARRGYRTLTLDEFATAMWERSDPRNALLLTFDDAYALADEIVTPILARHRFSAVMFAPWAHLGGRNTWNAGHPRLADLEIAGPDQLKEMEHGPWEVASHALRHVDLRKLDSNERRSQLTEARERLSELLGRPIRDLAYPYGYQDIGVRRDASAAGYRMAFTAGGSKAGDPYSLPRRSINGHDSRPMFLLKTSPVAPALYRSRQLSRHAAQWKPSIRIGVNE
jgi:peptidoglycan/xylan/chitin deacetylase (PgdA/CDA1 family)